MYYTEFGINLKLVCALGLERGYMHRGWHFLCFRIVVRLVTFFVRLVPYPTIVAFVLGFGVSFVGNDCRGFHGACGVTYR